MCQLPCIGDGYYDSEDKLKTCSSASHAEEEENDLICVFYLAADVGDGLRKGYLKGSERLRIRERDGVDREESSAQRALFQAPTSRGSEVALAVVHDVDAIPLVLPGQDGAASSDRPTLLVYDGCVVTGLALQELRNVKLMGSYSY